MPQYWAWVLDCRAQIKVFRLRVVGRNEKETGRVFIVNTGRIHKTAGTGRLECLRQLSNLKLAKIIRDGDDLMRLQKIDHLLLAALIRFQERFLIRWNILGTGRVRVGHGWIGQQCFERAVTR